MESEVQYRSKEGEQTAPVRGSAKIDLSPCHICHRKPSERKELDGYAHCEGCGRRTCYVCIRQCEGLSIDRDRDRYFGSQEVFGEDCSYDALAFSIQGDEMCFERGRTDGRDGGYHADVDEKIPGVGAWERDHILGHRAKVCSRCCVERGTEGEVWCLGCMRAEEGD